MFSYITDGYFPKGIRWLRDATALPPKPRCPVRYFIHVKDGKEMLDEEGVELSNMQAVKDEVLNVSVELLGGLNGSEFWNNEPWKLWVTDQPSGAGNTLLTLTFTAEVSALLAGNQSTADNASAARSEA
jgi:hypothetical protein